MVRQAWDRSTKHARQANASERRPPVMEQAFDETELRRSVYLNSFYEFVKYFWDVVIPETPVWNWHIEYLCDEAQVVAERVINEQPKLYDLVINVPPSSSKSTIFSQMLPAWMFARKPSVKYIGVSYVHQLALDHSTKTRNIMSSEKYVNLFPGVEFRPDQNTKCLMVGTKVLMANGRMRKIERLKIGDFVQSSDGRMVTHDRVTAVVNSGEKKLLKITLKDGTSVSCTPEHRLFGKDDWQEAGTLKVGDRLRVIGKSLRQHEKRITKDDAFLLALWLSDGTKNCTGFRFTKSCAKFPEVMKRVHEIAERRGWTVTLRHGKDHSLNVCYRQDIADTPTNFLRKYRLYNSIRVDTIRIPPEVFSAPDEVVREFIGTYIACDGCITGASKQIRFYSTSPRLASDFRMLLKRLGVQCSHRTERGRYKYKGEVRFTKICHTIMVARKNSVLRLANLNVYDKAQRLTEIVEHAKSKVALAGQHHRGDLDYLFEISEDIELRPVIKIEHVGKVATYDIETEKHHAFFAEGVLSHNSYFGTTKGGFRYCAASGGSVTGLHGSLICIDDPLNPQEAASKAELQETNTWITQTLPSRKTSSLITPMILVMQRLHVEDPSAIFLKKKRVKHICLPAQLTNKVNPPQVAKKYVNGVMDPVRLSPEILEEKREDMDNDFAFNGQYNQDPMVLGGGMFKLDKVQRGTPPDSFKAITRAWDKAATADGGDYTVGTLVAIDHDKKVWVLDVIREKLDTGRREALIRRTAAKDEEMMGCTVPITLEQEPGSGGKDSAVETVRGLQGFVVHVQTVGGTRSSAGKVHGDKVQRAMPVSSQMNNGNLYVPDGELKWFKAWKDELTYFPATKFDDQVDSMATAYNQISRKKRKAGASAV